MQSKTLLKITNFFFYVLIVGTPLFYYRWGVYPYGLSKSLFFQGVAECFFVSWLILAIYDKRFRPSWTPLMKVFAGFGTVLIITTVAGVDPWRSFWSTQERAVGVFTILHLLAITVAISGLARVIKMNKFLYVSLGTAAIVGIISFFQVYDPGFLISADGGKRPGSTFGNPTFLAGYIVPHIFLTLYLFLQLWQARIGKKMAYWGLALLLAVNVGTLFVTQTRGDILGVIAGAVALLIIFAVRPLSLSGVFGKRTIYIAICVLILISGSVFWITRTHSLWSVVPGLERFQSVSLNDRSLVPRFIALNAAWEGFKERPLLGWGWDNFNIVFNKHYDPRALESDYGETRFDKPHNFVLEYLVIGGVLLGFAYLAVFVALFFGLWRMRNRIWGSIMVAAIVAYIVRSLFVFETIGPLLMLYLVIGLTDGMRVREKSDASVLEEGNVRVSQGMLVAGVVAVIIPLYGVNILSFQASHYQFLGFNSFSNGHPTVAIQNFKKALNNWSPYRWNLKRDYATAVAEAYFYNPDKISSDDAWRAIRAMEEVVQEHPQDAYNHYALVDMYNQISDLSPEVLLPAAEREAAIALQLSPQRQEVYFSLAKTYVLEGRNEEAQALLEKAIALDPDVADAHFYYGLVLFTTNNLTKGYDEIQKGQALGRIWKNHNEMRVVANYFADAGHLNEAIALYEKVVVIDVKDLEARSKLGIAYFIQGDRDRAKLHLEIVNREFDLTKSPSYQDIKPILDALGITLDK
ncbi:MAG: tetratricopeptide repeat protein [Patescibacteria group bacterium]|nr:tetratricopeptide repeat protein [Patescibacteria group bacterium]